MSVRSFHRHWLIWMAVWLIGFASLAPVVSRVLAWDEAAHASMSGSPASAPVSTEICDPGAEEDEIAAAAPLMSQLSHHAHHAAMHHGSAHGDASGDFLEACGFCVLMGERLAPIVALLVALISLLLPLLRVRNVTRSCISASMHFLLCVAPRAPPRQCVSLSV